ncbi:hypothetical protein ECDEC8E_1212 [Escherichia coli DEC8E]|nr:hypothetical protein ECDEC8E_1212 [Escherichia coli DEC8E]
MTKTNIRIIQTKTHWKGIIFYITRKSGSLLSFYLYLSGV